MSSLKITPENNETFIVEKSNEPGTAAQGAMFRDFGNLKAGFIFGRKGESVNYTSSNQIRPVEGFISAGQGNFRGGLGVSWFERHANNQPDQNMKLKVGAMIGASESISFEPFAHYMLIGKEKSNGADPKHKDFAFGTRLVFSEKVKVFTGYRKYKVKNDVNARSRDAYGFGVSHQVAVDEKTSFVYALGFWRQTNNDHNILPINMAAETQVLSWLSLRGGLEYHFHNVQNETSRGDTTTGRIGLTASHEKLNFDFVVGSNSQNSGTGTAHVETADQVDSQAFGFDGGFFSGAALRYLW